MVQPLRPETVHNILVLGSIGLGNLLLFSPALRTLRRAYPDAHITMVVLDRSFKALYEGEPDVDDVVVVQPERDCSPVQIRRLVQQLRRTPWDVSITTFPANRLEYNVLPWLAGARFRIAHRYPAKYLRTLSFLQNAKVPVRMQLHDLEQNNALLEPLGLTVPTDQGMVLTIPEHTEREAVNFLERHAWSRVPLIGVHPGSSVARNMSFKRWPVEHFAACLAAIVKDFPSKILIFGGPSENPIKQSIAAQLGDQACSVEDLSFKGAAALIRRCRCFLTNDSGLMHVAVAMGVKTFALFGPTDPGRTAPWGDTHQVIRRNLECSPCWSIKNLGVGAVNCIYNNNICMQQIAAQDVAGAILHWLRTAPAGGGQEPDHEK